jgi:hypothetical protein
MARRPSPGTRVGGEPGPGEDPLVGDGGSSDEVGWEAPTRPELPLPSTDERNRKGKRPDVPVHEEPPQEAN